jgi:acetyl-CoA carboxylase, biotin carboxylase subunit
VFGKILIANRGEIALRIVRTCRELGIRTVVAHSKVDSDSLPVRVADESVCIGPADSAQSYLNIPRLIAAAEITDADAIHPGYGFLAENATFAEICRASAIRFIGPSADVIRLLGDKVRARELARKSDVPLLPGSDGALRDEADARASAEEIGYPLLLKAALGGGGRGMRIVRDSEGLSAALRAAQGEAAAAFGSSELYLEKYVQGARHVEVQVLADGQGHLIHLGERDCSIQRRHQKLVEESPSPGVTPPVRERLTAAALRLCRAAGYESAGTVEFLLDRTGRFYFLEVNTRIQVEHPVTEAVTGIDLVREQIRIAAGEPLGLSQEQVCFTGHAIECRVTAEDPVTFTPNPGRITSYLPPGGLGVRVDSHCFPGYVVPPYYDSLLAKVIAHGANRAEALARMRRALDELVLEGIRTTVPFHARLLAHPGFAEGDYATTFLETEF